MPKDESGMPEIYLHPGETCLVSQPTVIRTVLGSCVGAAFFARRLGAAGLCHPMLPVFPVRGSSGMHEIERRRYVDFAIRDLARQFDSLGALRSEVEVKLFGGADVLDIVNPTSRATVGELNRETALRVLCEENLRLVASRLGGTCGLHIQFHTGSGEVRVRQLK